ncbi:unnamed protein product [Brassica oleracea var. botrytis]|uniref:uncharacterized protein LOC106293505 n=1 Tax=Brassica oleracea var. oleracea TaxID=109376 RepID=UPI0006A6C686|nr:PREDICTED: uncharacterized protein LOC106293505 [Brassica oleracea var. oleracea]
MNRRAGIYAVHVLQFGGHVADLPSNYLIPLTNSVPTQAFATQCCTTGRARGLCFVVFADLVLQKESLWRNTPSMAARLRQRRLCLEMIRGAETTHHSYTPYVTSPWWWWQHDKGSV